MTNPVRSTCRSKCKGIFYADYNTPQTLNFQEPPLHKSKFLSFARREIQLWEEIYLDFLAVIPNLLVLHFEVNKSTFTTTCHSLTGQTNYRMQKRISWGPWRWCVSLSASQPARSYTRNASSSTPQRWTVWRHGIVQSWTKLCLLGFGDLRRSHRAWQIILFSLIMLIAHN